MLTLVSSSWPNVDGVIANVNEIPSSESSNGNFAIEFITANAPFTSLPCNGFAPGPNGSPARLPSGVFPVAFPYTTFDVIVKIDNVCFESLYVGCFFNLFKNLLTTSTAMLSTLSSSLPNWGYSPSIW